MNHQYPIRALTKLLSSHEWLTGFHNVKIQEELASADENGAEHYSDELTKIIQECRYTPDQIFNADETALFWKQMKFIYSWWL